MPNLYFFNSPLEFSLSLLISCAFLLLFLLSFLKYLGYMRDLRDMPLSQIRSAAQGQIALTGQTANIPSVSTRAPLSGKPCCWFEYKLEEQLSRIISKNSVDYYWHTISNGSSSHPFLLQHQKKSLLISPIGAQVICKNTFCQETSQLPEHLTKKIKNHQHLSSQNRKFRLTEKYLNINQTIHVLGYFSTQRASETISESESFSKIKTPSSLSLLQQSPHPKTPFIISSMPLNNLINRYKIIASSCFILAIFFAILNFIFIDNYLIH